MTTAYDFAATTAGGRRVVKGCQPSVPPAGIQADLENHL
jgi:hypothetical protein